MFKKTLYLLLVGILLFQSFCPLPLLFAQEDEKPSIVSIEEENVDIYIDYEQDVDLLEESVEEEVFVEENIVVARTEIQTSSLDASTLKITEVFCFGADEWIEITNFGENTFYWPLVLTNSRRNNGSFSGNITIPAYSSVIIANKTSSGIVDTKYIVENDARLSLTDTNAIAIELLLNGVLLDTFVVDSITVVAYKNKVPRLSFERLYEDGVWNIEASIPDHNFNIEVFTANPGKVTILGTETPWIWQGPLPKFPSKLLISEVFFDDAYSCTKKDIKDRYCDDEEAYHPNEERIEIFNIGEGSFEGVLTLSGTVFSGDLHSYTYSNVSIPAGGYIVLANTGYFFRIPNNEGLILNSVNGFPDFDIPDDKELLLDLIVDDEVVDTFLVLEHWMKDWSYYFESVHKVVLESDTLITRAATHKNENIYSDYMANPWILHTSVDINSPFDYRYEDGHRPIKPIDPTSPDICKKVVEDLFTLSEVWRGNERYAPYLEFMIHEDMEWDYDVLLFTGSLLQNFFVFNLDEEQEFYDRSLLEKNTRMILTRDVGELSGAGLLTLGYHPDIVFNDGWWELEIYWWDGQSRQLLDMVKVLSATPGKSTYHNWLVRRCWDNIDVVDEFSPGFGQEVLEYFSPSSEYNVKVVETVKYVGGGGWCSCPSKEQLCGSTFEQNIIEVPVEDTTVVDEPKERGTETSDDEGSEHASGLIKIITIEPKSPESITLQSFLPYDIDFTKHTLYLKTSTATTKKYIDGILSANSIDTFTKNFWFLDAGACVSLFSGGVLLDNLCYVAEIPQKETEKKDEIPPFNPAEYQVKIVDILYDPEGSDTDNETITLQNFSSQTLDLSFIKLKINTTNKKLTGTLSAGETKTFKGTFGFPNSTKSGEDVMVSLFYDTTIFDTYFYNPNTPKILVQSGEVKVYSVLDGDTFRFRKEDGTLQSVRLLGVDAPESTTTRYRHTECFGTEAKTYLTNLIKNKNIRLEYDFTQQQVDSYGRLLAYVYLGDVLVNEKMLADGYAKEYTYKSDYQFQSSFQSAEQFAKTKSVWLRSASTCGISIEDAPEAWGFDYDKLSFKIASLEYDPVGTDKDNEVVVLSLDLMEGSGLLWIDFSDNFKLTIFPWSEYTTGTTKNKSLENFWFLPLADTFTLKGDFQMPNTKATCVSLKYKEYTFDTRCYNPGSEEEMTLSGEVITSALPAISIRSLLPNPSGKDNEKEEITLFWEGDGFLDELHLSPEFYLLINNKTKKKLNGILLPNQEIMIKGTFSFPNTASCVTLMKGTEPISDFCYGKAGEGVRFSSNNVAVSEIPNEEIAVVKKITLVKKDDQLCISYNKVVFGCKKIPNSTTEKNTKLLSFQNNYLAELEKYLKNNYSLLYYESDLKELFDLYSATKKEIKAGGYTFNRKGENFSLTNVASLRSTQYNQSASEYLVWRVVEHLPSSLLAYYQQEKEKWYGELRQE